MYNILKTLETRKYKRTHLTCFCLCTLNTSFNVGLLTFFTVSRRWILWECSQFFLNLAVKSKILLNIVEESVLLHFPKFIGEKVKFLIFLCHTTSIIFSSNTIQNWYILVPADRGPPGKWPIKWRLCHVSSGCPI